MDGCVRVRGGRWLKSWRCCSLVLRAARLLLAPAGGLVCVRALVLRAARLLLALVCVGAAGRRAAIGVYADPHKLDVSHATTQQASLRNSREKVCETIIKMKSSRQSIQEIKDAGYTNGNLGCRVTRTRRKLWSGAWPISSRTSLRSSWMSSSR